MKTLLIIVLLGFVLLFFPRCSMLEPDVEEYADLEAEIAREVEANRIPSVSAWVVKEDALVWQHHVGYADLAMQKPADTNTMYRLASVSKLVVVTAVMQLREQGLIDLDADVNTYLPFSVRNPNYPDDKITPYHLLTHSSGLAWPESDAVVPGYYVEYPLDDAPALGEWLPQFIMPQGSAYVPAVWEDSRPGERAGYSNIGVALLGYLVERVSGMDFNEYCKQHIFEPLEMFNTSFNYADLDMDHVATLYRSPTSSAAPLRQMGYPSADLKGTVEDFSHFILAYMNGGRYKDARILQEGTVREILELRNPTSGICLIWNQTLDDWYGHAGGEVGVAAYVEFQRDRHVGLMVVANYRHSSIYPGGKIHALVRRMARRYY